MELEIIKNSLAEIDKYRSVRKKIKNITSTSTVTNDCLVEMDNGDIIKTKFEFFGFFYPESKVWCWAWGHTITNELWKYLSKQMLLYSLKSDELSGYIKNILMTPRCPISHSVHLDIILAIGLSVIKKKLFFRKKYLGAILYLVIEDEDKIMRLSEEASDFKMNKY
jgi:hypothetical protein